MFDAIFNTKRNWTEAEKRAQSAAEAAAAATTPEQDFFTRLQEAVAQLQDDQDQALADAQNMRALMQALLQNEELRLTNQEGKDSPRVVSIRERSIYNQVVSRALDSAIQVANIHTPAVQLDGALIHGQVLDDNGLAVAGLKVQVEDASGQSIEELGSAMTDASGYYSLPLTPEALEKYRARAGGRATLTVRSAAGNILSQASQPVDVGANTKVFRPMTVNRTGRSVPTAGEGEKVEEPPEATKRPTRSSKKKKTGGGEAT